MSEQESQVAGVGLTPNQLNKYSWRVERFVAKIFNQEPLQLAIGKDIIPNLITVEGKTFTPNENSQDEVVDAIQNITNHKKIYVTGIVDDQEIKVVSSQIVKTVEFGGKPSGYEVKLEHAMLGSVKHKLMMAVDENKGQPITINIGPNSYSGITDVVSTPKTPKSDIHFITSEGEEVGFISHKAGKKPSDFQQYSGVSKFYDHPEVITFIDDLNDCYEQSIPRKTLLRRTIQDEELQLKSIYGHHFGSGEYGIDNVNLFIQGNVDLVKIDNETYDLAGSIVAYNGDKLVDAYEPHLMVTYRSGRQNRYLSNGRLGIYPKMSFGKKIEDF